MNIGWISQALPYLPSRGGFRLYGGNLILRLSRRHRIDLVSLLCDDDAQNLDWARQYCASVNTVPVNGIGLSRRFASALSGYLWGKPLNHRAPFNSIVEAGLKSRKWDVLHIEGGFVGGLVPPEFPLAKVLSVHDSEVLRAQEMLNCGLPLRKRFDCLVRKYWEPRYERLVYPRYERCVVVADRDRAFVQELVPRARIALIPYGTDAEYFYPVPVEKEHATLVFHSHLGYPPNIQAALEFANEIFPLVRRERPDATFHLVGADPDPRIQALTLRPGIKLSPNLPDLRPAVCSARIYVCAIRYGTGLKSKVLEAMAMQMPIVAYHPGSTVGIDCIYGKHLLAAENPQEFAAHVLDLLRYPDRADQIALAGRHLVEEKYSWESRACAYEELYQQVIEERRGRMNRCG